MLFQKSLQDAGGWHAGPCPFWAGNRLIQGIVVGFDEMGDREELKEIAEVLDFSPVLNQEQLWLADELRKSVFSYKITL